MVPYEKLKKSNGKRQHVVKKAARLTIDLENALSNQAKAEERARCAEATCRLQQKESDRQQQWQEHGQQQAQQQQAQQQQAQQQAQQQGWQQNHCATQQHRALFAGRRKTRKRRQ
jgi:hypothetical protein